MDVLLALDDGTIVTRAEIGPPHTELSSMELTIPVWFFTEAGDRVLVMDVLHKLEVLPIPSPEEQLEIVRPTIEAYQAAHPVPEV